MWRWWWVLVLVLVWYVAGAKFGYRRDGRGVRAAQVFMSGEKMCRLTMWRCRSVVNYAQKIAVGRSVLVPHIYTSFHSLFRTHFTVEVKRTSTFAERVCYHYSPIQKQSAKLNTLATWFYRLQNDKEDFVWKDLYVDQNTRRRTIWLTKEKIETLQ